MADNEQQVVPQTQRAQLNVSQSDVERAAAYWRGIAAAADRQTQAQQLSQTQTQDVRQVERERNAVVMRM